MPHEVIARSRHSAPAQQPAGHEVSSQMQSPATQRCPATHATPSPHAHAPSVPHPSERIASHARQTEPSAPQAIADCGKQDAPEQHPSAQLAASQPEQLPAAHVWPLGHLEQARPAAPQASLALPGRQVDPSQHPDSHESASQMHTPRSQR
jgi:hypothetical protein